MSDTRLIEAALAAGAAGAVLIPQRQIVLSAEFRSSRAAVFPAMGTTGLS